MSRRLDPEDGLRAALFSALAIFVLSLAAFAFFVIAPMAGPLTRPPAASAGPPPETRMPDAGAPALITLERPSPVSPQVPENPRPAVPPAAAVDGGGSPPDRTPASPPRMPPAQTPARQGEPPAAARSAAPAPGRTPQTPPRPAAVQIPASRPARPEPAPALQGTLVFVIDDAGNSLTALEPFLRFPGPLTIAVLPGLPWSAEAARRIRAAGKELILHQPMEALGGQDPGPGAIYAGMDAGEIRRIINKNIDGIGPVAGINNHQGSRVTGDRAMMETVLSVCRERGIYFLDSRTTAGTAAPEAARRLSVKIGERDIFLDNVQDPAAMTESLREGLERARNRGRAVMIGHVWSPGLAPLLASEYEKLTRQGYRVATVSACLAEK